MADALNIIQRAVERGVGQVDLVRAAAACVRAIRPLASVGNKPDILAAQAAAERWANTPSAVNAGLALAAVPNLDGLRENDPADIDVCLSVAAAMAAVAAANSDFAVVAAPLAVEFAEKVAAGRGIDLAPIVTAEFL